MIHVFSYRSHKKSAHMLHNARHPASARSFKVLEMILIVYDNRPVTCQTYPSLHVPAVQGPSHE